MPSPNDLYTALCNRFGKTAVDAKLNDMGSFWSLGGLANMLSVTMARIVPFPDPCAMAVLESVGEGMLLGQTIPVRVVAVPSGRWCIQPKHIYWDNWVCGSPNRYDTKAAAIIAALDAKGGA